MNTLSETVTETENMGVSLYEVEHAYEQLKNVVVKTPLLRNNNLSEEFGANIYLKREDLQVVRSYKIRGAYNKMNSLKKTEKLKGVVCASAGNHAQGVAYSCNLLGIKGVIFMPVITPAKKVKQVKLFGKENVEVVLTGDTFDDAYAKALAYSESKNSIFVHPFDDDKVIAGQGTVALEIFEQAEFPIDYLFVPVGGGAMRFATLPAKAEPTRAGHTTMTFGGGSRWFSKAHLAFTIALRFYLTPPATATGDAAVRGRKRVTLLSAGISIK